MADCPSCGTELAPNAPVGLCPACLFRGGAAMVPATPIVHSDFEPPEPEVLDVLFQDYEILEMIGRGGMGAVYKARQVSLGRTVAIKILPPGPASDAEFAERFRREAAAMANLDHPNIVTLHDYGEREGCFYFNMEFVDGVDLAQRLGSSSLTTDEALAIVPQVCDALQYSHDRGVVHRDIKPGNILIDRAGKVKIADFGLAKLVGPELGDFDLTRTSTSLGTPRYMAPEQMDSAPSTDHRADIYALGVVIYEMLTGEVPAGRFEPPSQRVDGLVDHFDDLVLRAMNTDPAKRFEQVSELKSGMMEAGDLMRTVPGGKRQAARRFWWSRVFPVGLASALIGALLVVWFINREPQTREVPGERPSTELARWHEDLRTKPGFQWGASGGDGGGVFTLTLRENGQVTVSGDNRYGQLDGVAELRDIVQVAAGEGKRGAHALALSAHGRVTAWGDNTYGQCDVPEAALAGIVQIAAGELHSVALDQDGNLILWGHSREGAAAIPKQLVGAKVRMVAAGSGFNLAIKGSGKVVAWGANESGQCDVPDDLGYVETIAAEGGSASAYLKGGTVQNWGESGD